MVELMTSAEIDAMAAAGAVVAEALKAVVEPFLNYQPRWAAAASPFPAVSSRRPAVRTPPTRTGGHCAPRRVPAPRTASTQSRSPPTAHAS